jgi:hypothetical protein
LDEFDNQSDGSDGAWASLPFIFHSSFQSFTSSTFIIFLLSFFWWCQIVLIFLLYIEIFLFRRKALLGCRFIV